MRFSPCTSALLLFFAVVSTALARAQTQPAPASEKPLRAEAALDFSLLRSNAPPGGCSCINLSGGSASVAWLLKPTGSFALVGEVAAAHAGNISGTSNDLTLSAYTVGGRYRPRLGHSAWQPFGQVLVGVAHAGGSLVQGSASTVSNAGAAFASSLGGGLDLRVSRNLSFRLAEADYLITTFDNGGNNHQNNLRGGAGLVLRFGAR